MDSKYLVECFALDTRESQPNGGPRVHRQSKERIRAQGQGNVLVLEVLASSGGNQVRGQAVVVATVYAQ